MSEIHPVSFQRHGKKRLLPISSWSFAATHHLAPLLVAEFSQAVRRFPIVFVRQGEVALPFALLGFHEGKNLLIDQKNQWVVDYIPACFRRAPFLMARRQQEETEYVLCVDEAAGLLSDVDGAPLFDEDGNKSEALDHAFNFAAQYLRQSAASEVLAGLLQEFDLLEPFPIQLKDEKQTLKIEGLLRVSEEKLNALADEAFLRLRAAGALAPIYAHLYSLGSVATLAGRLQVASPQPPTEAFTLPDSFKF